LNLIDILTTIMKSKHIMYKPDCTLLVCVCLVFLTQWNLVMESMTRFHSVRNTRHTHIYRRN